MPNPDLREYADLTLFDRDPQEVFDAAITDLLASLPDLQVREGHIEAELLEAMALTVAELVYAINRVPNAVAAILFGLFDVAPDPGAQPTVDVEFTLSDDAGHTIPAGTRVQLTIGGGLDPVVFTTDSDLVVAATFTTGVVSATGDRYTADANGIAAGTSLQLLDGIFFVDAVVTDTDVADGADPETDSDWRTRAVQRLQRLSSVLVLPTHFTARALEEVEILRALTLDQYDPGTGPSPGDNQGHVTVAVYGDGALVSAGTQAALETAMEDEALAGLDVHIIDPTITQVEVDVTVLRLDGYDDATVQANVEAALQAFLSTETWPWTGTVYLNDLIPVIDLAAGVDRVTALLIDEEGGVPVAADLAIAGDAPLADAGTITVTVTAP